MEREDETPAELVGYESGEVGTLNGPRMQRVARFVVVLAIVALVLPGVLVSIGTATRTAELACQVVGSTEAAGSTFEARFEWSGGEGPGWYCYATGFGGHELQLRFLGFIPEVRVVPGSPGVDV